MVFQYIIIAIILVACVSYATFLIWKSWQSNIKCKQYKCSGCPFLEKCEKKQKKL